jgi:hypothetical protein
MTELSVVFVAILLPWATGALLVYAIDKRLTLLDLGYASALGYLLGIVTAAIFYAIQLRVFGLSSPRWSAVVLVGVAVSCGLIVQQRGTAEQFLSRGNAQKKTVLWYVIFFMLSIKLAVIAFEAVRQPIVSWDAWTTWLMRSRIWVEGGAYVAFTEASNALEVPLGYAIEAWRYPELVSWIAAWSAAWGQQWNESYAVLPWLSLVVVVPLGLYAALRRVDVPPAGAIVAAFALVSLPLVGAHLAMTGYADIWLGTALFFSLVSGFRWVRTRHRADLALAMISLSIAAAIKPEGLVWVAVFPLVYLVSRLGSRAFLGLIMGGVGVMLLLFQLEGVRFDLPLLGAITLGLPPSITELGWHLTIYGNWHFLFWLLPAVLLLILFSARGLPTDQARLCLLAWVLFSLGGFLFLFLWTDSAEWARLGTANNRVMLQLVPGLIFWLTVELSENPMLQRFSRPTW